MVSCLATDQAVLLSTVYDDFVHEVESNKYQHKLKICKNDIPGQRWLLSRLNQNFNGLLEVHLKHNRHGLVLFLKNCDLVAAMSSALGKQVMGVKHAHAQAVWTGLVDRTTGLTFDLKKETFIMGIAMRLGWSVRSTCSFSRRP